MAINSRDKGARGERLWRNVLRDAGYGSAQRGQQFAGGTDSPDVKCEELQDVHWEVKFVENLNVGKAIEQAIRDADGKKIPIVAHKKKNKPWLITLPADEFIRQFLTVRFPAPPSSEGAAVSASDDCDANSDAGGDN